MTRKVSCPFFQASFIHHKIQAFSKVQGTKIGSSKIAKEIQGVALKPHHFGGLEIPYLPLDELLATCDYISLHAPLLPSTKHMISFEKLAIMKKGIMKHGGQHETSEQVTTMKFPPFARKKWNIMKLWNDRVRKQKGSKVCLLTEYGPVLKQMYSKSHHSFCFLFVPLFWSNGSCEISMNIVLPEKLRQIFSQGLWIHLVVDLLTPEPWFTVTLSETDIARSLTLLLCHSPSLLIRWWDLLGTTWSWGLKTGVIAGAAMDVVENESAILLQDQNWMGRCGTSTGWFEQSEQLWSIQFLKS